MFVNPSSGYFFRWQLHASHKLSVPLHKAFLFNVEPTNVALEFLFCGMILAVVFNYIIHYFRIIVTWKGNTGCLRALWDCCMSREDREMQQKPYWHTLLTRLLTPGSGERVIERDFLLPPQRYSHTSIKDANIIAGYVVVGKLRCRRG